MPFAEFTGINTVADGNWQKRGYGSQGYFVLERPTNTGNPSEVILQPSYMFKVTHGSFTYNNFTDGSLASYPYNVNYPDSSGSSGCCLASSSATGKNYIPCAIRGTQNTVYSMTIYAYSLDGINRTINYDLCNSGSPSTVYATVTFNTGTSQGNYVNLIYNSSDINTFALYAYDPTSTNTAIINAFFFDLYTPSLIGGFNFPRVGSTFI